MSDVIFLNLRNSNNNNNRNNVFCTVEMFHLRRRALHVFSEAERVLKFKAVCDRGDSESLSELGRLMSASHESCCNLYECSCEELDRLVELAM